MPSLLHQHAAALIEHRTGLSTSRRSDIDALLSELSGGDVFTLIEQLRSQEINAPVWQGVIRALAIGETYFFRDETHFAALRKDILPALILKRRQQKNLTLNLWSVGCATGEEPYSLAILLYEMLNDLSHWTINLIGTDINAQALETARRGIYRAWSFRQTDIQTSAHFERVEDGWQLKPHIRERVTFQQSSLLAGTNITFDIIFCRNVLLYFSREHAVAAEAVLREALHPGGWLFLGHSETLKGSDWLMHQFPGSPIYQKPFANARLEREIIAASENTGDITSYYEDAVRAYHAENHDETEHLLERLLAQHSDHARGWTLMACLAADRHQIQAAHRHLDRALELNPLLADAHYLRALLYREEARIDETQQALRAALYANRLHTLAGYTLGTLYAESGDFDRAVKLWENVQTTIARMLPDQLLSDLSELTAGRLAALIGEQLAIWRG